MPPRRIILFFGNIYILVYVLIFVEGIRVVLMFLYDLFVVILRGREMSGRDARTCAKSPSATLSATFQIATVTFRHSLDFF